MAKKRKKKSVARRGYRPQRSSGMGAVDFNSVLFAALGGAGSEILNRIIPSTIDPKLVAGGKIAVGVFAPSLVKDAKTKAMMQAIGNGIIAASTVDLLQSLGFFQGIGLPDKENSNDVDELAVAIEGVDRNMIAADVLADDLSVINADVLADDLDVVNGDMMMDLM